jgi:hypothetical protein
VANQSVADGAWHFLAGERNGANWRLFIDGELVATKTNMTSIRTNNTQNASIGARVTTFGDNAWFFDGSLANIQVYNRALSVGEVGTIYDAGLSIPISIVTGYAPLLWALPIYDNLSAPRDLSGGGFQLVPFGALNFGQTPLPLAIDPTIPTTRQIISAVPETSTMWQIQLGGQGRVTLVLAEPFAPGWEASWSGGKTQAFPMFDNAVTAFNMTSNGPTSIQLKYSYQDTLLAGASASVLGYPVLMLGVSVYGKPFGLTRSHLHNRSRHQTSFAVPTKEP